MVAEKTYDDNRDDAAQMPKAAAGEGPARSQRKRRAGAE